MDFYENLIELIFSFWIIDIVEFQYKKDYCPYLKKTHNPLILKQSS